MGTTKAAGQQVDRVHPRTSWAWSQRPGHHPHRRPGARAPCSYLLTQHGEQEVHEHGVLARVLLTQCADGLDHHHLGQTDMRERWPRHLVVTSRTQCQRSPSSGRAGPWEQQAETRGEPHLHPRGARSPEPPRQGGTHSSPEAQIQTLGPPTQTSRKVRQPRHPACAASPLPHHSHP